VRPCRIRAEIARISSRCSSRDGLLAWTAAACPDFRAAVAAYFAGRLEDG